MTSGDTARWSSRAARLREAFDESFARPAESAIVRGTPVLSVTIGGTPCAIRVRECAGVIASATVSAVPSQVGGFLGFTASGGVVRPVYDLASLLGLPAGVGARPPLVLAAAHAVAFAVEAIEGHDALDGEERELADFVSVGGAQRRLVALGPVMDAIAREARDRGAQERTEMMRKWTFAGKITAALALMVALSVVVSALAAYGLQTVVSSKDEVIEVDAENLALAERLYRLTQQQRAAVRDFLLAPDERFVTEIATAQREADDVMQRLQEHGVSAAPQLRTIDREYRALIEQVVAQRRQAGADPSASAGSLSRMVAIRQQVEQQVGQLLDQQRRQLDLKRQASTDVARNVTTAVIGGAVLALIVAIVAAIALSRTLSAQIGSAVQHVQSSAAELQAAANQQASGSKEQATAMAEITTTISELLATSRQIAESAQRVARVAEETAGSARGGEQTVQEGSESIGGIKRQVDAIVTHMLDLGRKSQEIGGILEIITELADQTDILAVNAAIEAAGAGDSGRRFGVVAEEIRKLADRVGGSAKEIRGLISDVRASVNASVMTTETASKTVEAGTAHFADVSTSFRQISVLVRTTNEAAREIELSTKQQSTAVEQVNRGVADVAQAAKETEVTSSQMLETVSQLAALSMDLSRLIRPETAA